MFSFLKKSSQEVGTDKVWKTKLARNKGIAVEALSSLKEGRVPAVFFFFESDQQEFIKFLDSSKAPNFVLTPGNVHEATGQRTVIFIVDALAIGSPGVNGFLLQTSKAPGLNVIFHGHYPLIPQETTILEKLDQCVGPIPRVFCLSLEDGLLETFGAERIKPLMQTLGMKDDECIEHAMVTKAIFRACEKLGSLATHELKTNSEASWFEKNVKKDK